MKAPSIAPPSARITAAIVKSGEVKCSLRSGERLNVAQALEKALVGINGYGGGHEHACGAAVPVEQFDLFIEQLEDAIGK